MAAWKRMMSHKIPLESSEKSRSSVVYTMTLFNFFSMSKYSVYSDYSPKFEFANATWLFRFYVDNESCLKYGRKHFDVSIIRKTSEVPNHKIFYTVTLFDTNGEKYNDFYNVDVFDEDNLQHNVAYFIEKSYKQSKYDTLKLICELTVCDKSTKIEKVSKVELPMSCKDVETLCQDFKEFFLNKQNCDLTLKVGEKEFPVHRSILMARSKVFEAMLSHDMKEKNSGIIDVSDCDSQAIEQFLFYVYSGKVEMLNSDNALNIYYVADKYNLALLKQECREFIKKSLSPSKICDVIQFAVDHTDTDLLNYATEYFVKNTTEILSTVEWMLFLKSNFITANELMLKASKKWDCNKT